MANEYTVNAADLTAVADAIREKGGISAALSFPDGFAQAIAAIESGSESGSQVAKGTIIRTTASKNINLSLDFSPTVFVAVSTKTMYKSNVIKTIIIINEKQYACIESYSYDSDSYNYSYYTSSSSGIIYDNGTAIITAQYNFAKSEYAWLAVA